MGDYVVSEGFKKRFIEGDPPDISFFDFVTTHPIILRGFIVCVIIVLSGFIANLWGGDRVRKFINAREKTDELIWAWQVGLVTGFISAAIILWK